MTIDINLILKGETNFKIDFFSDENVIQLFNNNNSNDMFDVKAFSVKTYTKRINQRSYIESIMNVTVQNCSLVDYIEKNHIIEINNYKTLETSEYLNLKLKEFLLDILSNTFEGNKICRVKNIDIKEISIRFNDQEKTTNSIGQEKVENALISDGIIKVNNKRKISIL